MTGTDPPQYRSSHKRWQAKMNIHEYQAYDLLRHYGVAVRSGFCADTAEAVEVGLKGYPPKPLVVKAQIHSGGRGKAGGIQFADSPAAAAQAARSMLGMTLITAQTGPTGRTVRKVLIGEAVPIEREYYLGLLVDRSTATSTFVGSREGGVEIEQVAEASPEKIVTVAVDPFEGFRPHHARNMARKLGMEGDQAKSLGQMMHGMFRLFTEKDASLVEINPLAVTEAGDLMAVDAKVQFDDNGLFRHQDILALRDPDEEEPNEVRAAHHGLSYIKLDGRIGCLVNGAGLAMATMDMIKIHGASPANFLDVGGSASTQKVTEAFKMLLDDPSVSGILVNIFGGIMKCDVIAAGIVEASRLLGIQVPVVVRLDGTNAQEGKDILKTSGLNLMVAHSLGEAARLIVKKVLGNGHSS